ncbi:Uma2 family endonuclease [Kribbella lupini]|uniref:Uma2 family endonuclease n=1 Tax=Kribbella lupini TaxID=291602 RepID=A0ABP4MM97_9ACTN
MPPGTPRTLEPGRFTLADLDSLPDGLRHELIGGQLLVTPPPLRSHQRAAGQLMLVLHKNCPSELEVFPGPLEFRPAAGHVLLPDLLVCRREDVGLRSIDRLVLAVEILSPTTRTVDHVLKRALYADAGVASYWLFDPEAEELTVLELVGSAYVERAVVKGNEIFEASLPFVVPVVPSALVRPVNGG